MQPVADRVAEMLRQGADVIDVGAYSTRPGAAEVSAEEELHRLREALPLVVSAVRESAPSGRYIPVSVDTFRAQVARTCVEQWGCDWVNDVSGGTYDPEMLPWVAESGTPYIMMHIYPTELQLAYPDGVIELFDTGGDGSVAAIINQLNSKITALEMAKDILAAAD